MFCFFSREKTIHTQKKKGRGDTAKILPSVYRYTEQLRTGRKWVCFDMINDTPFRVSHRGSLISIESADNTIGFSYSKGNVARGSRSSNRKNLVTDAVSACHRVL